MTAFVLYGERAVKNAASAVVRFEDAMASILVNSSCVVFGKFVFSSNVAIVFYFFEFGGSDQFPPSSIYTDIIFTIM